MPVQRQCLLGVALGCSVTCAGTFTQVAEAGWDGLLLPLATCTHSMRRIHPMVGLVSHQQPEEQAGVRRILLGLKSRVGSNVRTEMSGLLDALLVYPATMSLPAAAMPAALPVLPPIWIQWIWASFSLPIRINYGAGPCSGVDGMVKHVHSVTPPTACVAAAGAMPATC